MTTRLERGIRIIEMLQQGVPKTVAQIASEMDVSRRTIFRDIALMREMGIPVSMNPETSAYFCPRGEESLVSRLFRDSNQRQVQDWTIRFLEDAISKGQTVTIREQDPKSSHEKETQTNWVTRHVTPLEISFDHRGWRLVFLDDDSSLPDGEMGTESQTPRQRVNATRSTPPRVVTLSHIQVETA